MSNGIESSIDVERAKLQWLTGEDGGREHETSK